MPKKTKIVNYSIQEKFLTLTRSHDLLNNLKVSFFFFLYCSLSLKYWQPEKKTFVYPWTTKVKILSLAPKNGLNEPPVDLQLLVFTLFISVDLQEGGLEFIYIGCRILVSISSTFYARIFCTKFLRQKLQSSVLGFNFFV